MKFLSRLACVALIVGLGACQDQGPDRFRNPVDIPLVPQMMAKFSGISYTFANGDFFESRFAGAPMQLTFTSGTAFRAEGNGKVWEGTVTYPAAPGSVAALSVEFSTEFVRPRNATSVFQNNLLWFGNSNPEQNPIPGVGFQRAVMSFSSDNSSALWFNNIGSSPQGTPSGWNFQTCVLGVSLSVGPYGTSTASYNLSGGC